MAYVAQDPTDLLNTLQDVTSGAVELEMVEMDAAADVRERVLDEDSDVGLVIPAGFDDAVAAGESPPLDVILREEAPSGANYVAAAIEQSVEVMAGRAPPATVQVDVISDEEAEQDISIFEEIGPREYFVLSTIIILVAMNSILVVSMILADEAEKKTLDALVMIASYTDVVVAKALVGLFYVATSVVILIGLTGLVPEDPLLFTVAILLFAVAMIGIGLLLGGLITNANQLNTWAGFFLIPVIAPAFMVGFPLPDVVETILLFLSTSQAMRIAINGLMGSTLFPDVWLSILVLVLWAVAAYGLLVLRLSRREA